MPRETQRYVSSRNSVSIFDTNPAQSFQLHGQQRSCAPASYSEHRGNRERQSAVVTSAAETPGAIAAIVALPCCAMWPNVLITPHTVPSNPRNGRHSPPAGSGRLLSTIPARPCFPASAYMFHALERDVFFLPSPAAPGAARPVPGCRLVTMNSGQPSAWMRRSNMSITPFCDLNSA